MPPHARWVNPDPPLPRMAVLVVEDNPSVASLLQRGLERDGYSVDVAVDGNEALALGWRTPTSPSCSTS